MKKLLKKYLFITVILILCAIQGEAAYAANKDFFITEDGLLARYYGSDTVVKVPSTVKVIREGAFKDCTHIETLILPEGVTKIPQDAFSGCTNLKHITLPSTLEEIDEDVFNNCISLKEVYIPKSVKLWYMYINDDYKDGIERYEVDPKNTKFSSIDGIVYNKAMTSLLYYPYNRKEDTYTLPDSVTDISESDFGYAKNLKHIVFNAKVANKSEYGIDNPNFLNGTLESITVPANNKTFCDINGVLFSKDKKILFAYPEKRVGKTYKIPAGTERLYFGSFSTCNYESFNLKYILFPDGIKTIDGCTGYYSAMDDAIPNRELVFYCKKGSIAETYAKSKGMWFADDKTIQKSALLLSDSELSLAPNETAYIESFLVYTDAHQSVSWKSSNPSVVTTDQKGWLTAKSSGSAVITATTKSGLKATCSITVEVPQ